MMSEVIDYEFYEEITCPNCWGSGIVNVCCDDLCATSDYCIHGDGEVICHVCNGDGYIVSEIDQERE